MRRRDFLKRLAAAAALGGVSGWSNTLHSKERPADRHGLLLPARKLGRAGAEVTALCVGGAHVHSAMGREDAGRFLNASIEAGIRFFDTAESYGAGESETRFGLYLCPKYRDEIFLMTKSRARTASAARRHLDESLRRMKTDRLDLWQIHSIDSPDDVDERIEGGVVDAFLEAKAGGKTRFIGFTGHARYSAMLRMLERLKGMGVEMDTCQMPVNVVDPGYESFVLNVLPPLVERGYGVLAMKTLVYGQLFGRRTSWNWARPGEPGKAIGEKLTVEEALAFVWSLPVASLVSGMTNIRELNENAGLCRSARFLDEEKRRLIIERVAGLAGPAMEFYKA